MLHYKNLLYQEHEVEPGCTVALYTISIISYSQVTTINCPTSRDSCRLCCSL